MTNGVSVRELVLDILIEVNEKEQYSHLVIRDVLNKYQYLEKQERAFLTRLAEGTIEHPLHNAPIAYSSLSAHRCAAPRQKLENYAKPS